MKNSTKIFVPEEGRGFWAGGAHLAERTENAVEVPWAQIMAQNRGAATKPRFVHGDLTSKNGDFMGFRADL
jgi:hypothetical protein